VLALCLPVNPREAKGNVAINHIVALAAVIVSIATNVALYVHLGSTMNARFDSVDRKFESMERRLELIQGDTHQMDIRLSKLEM
jgi:hypothetical protein